MCRSPINRLPSLSFLSFLVSFSHLSSFSGPMWSPLLTLTLFSAPPPGSFRIRASCVLRRLRKLHSYWMQPSPHAAPADLMQMRTRDATPTCCSRCIFTSTGWRRAAREEVSNTRSLYIYVAVFQQVGTFFNVSISQYSLANV